MIYYFVKSRTLTPFICVGLLKGKVMVTAESRLNNNFGKDNTPEVNEVESTYAVKEK